MTSRVLTVPNHGADVSPRISSAAALGREMNRITVEDAVSLRPADEMVEVIRVAFFKAYPRQRAEELLAQIGRPL